MGAEDALRPGELTELLRLRKRVAREKLRIAVKAGRLVRLNCTWFDCYSHKTEAHHPDYAYPLSVIWLCRKHHMKHHGALSWVTRFEAYQEMFGLEKG